MFRKGSSGAMGTGLSFNLGGVEFGYRADPAGIGRRTRICRLSEVFSRTMKMRRGQ